MKKCKAVIGSYNGIFETDTGICLSIDEKNNRVVEGYLHKGNFIDLKNWKMYRVIERDASEQITEKEFYRVKLNVEYALEIKEKKYQVNSPKSENRNKTKTIGSIRKR